MIQSKLKNRLLPLLGALLVLLLILTSCGTADENTAKKDTSESETKVEENQENESEETEETEEPEGTKLVIASFNIAAGKKVGFYYPLLAEDIVASGADIVGIQEIDQVTTRNSYQDTLEILSQETGMEYYAFAPALTPYQEGEYGIGVLSKYPIVSYEFYQLPMLSDTEEQRVLLHAKIDVNGETLDFFVTHGQQVCIRRQLEKANEYISQCESFILAGDFNTSNYGNYKLIENSYTVVGELNPILTSEEHSFDNLVISNDIVSKNVRTIDTQHSDHYMLLADVTLPVKE